MLADEEALSDARRLMVVRFKILKLLFPILQITINEFHTQLNNMSLFLLVSLSLRCYLGIVHGLSSENPAWNVRIKAALLRRLRISLLKQSVDFELF